MGARVRKRITFFGWVQGVGFRYRARQAASLAGATGWAENRDDGAVTMEIQGTQEQIARVIALIEEGRFIRIERMEETDLPVLEDERGFSTRDAAW